MLSGQGRHRRPRQAPAIVVAAGVTGSALALPLFAATGASAADAGTWDRVADCESGGAWSADEGNGYYGGLQLSQETWEDYGGLAYAPSPDQASRSQQIDIGEKVLADQGPKAWPHCGPASGLSKGGEKADVDPGLPVTPERSSGSADGSSGGGKDGGKDGGKETSGEASRDGADSDGSRDARDKDHEAGDTAREDKGESKGTGKHRKPDADTGADGADQDADKDADQDTGKDGERTRPGKGDATPPGDSERPERPEGSEDPADAPSGRHRGPSGDPSAPGGPDATEGRAGGAADGSDGGGRHASRGEARGEGGARDTGDARGTYTVRSGDNLSTIADTHDLDGGWSSLYEGNKNTVGGDPDLILPGQRLELGEGQAADAARK
ncbi:transglycosylase family protein [Streptomyces sp. G45]|uniref:transglycosylase family protein n=1 Tax=Streptomyces sp. G45 TaxID=3406627 RepID=UPI003C25E0EF